MSAGSEDIDNDDMLRADISSSGAAADSAETDEKLKKLPRLLRYAMLSGKNGSFLRARLVAEIDELCPNLPRNIAWSSDHAIATGIALASELDHRAVIHDQPDWRSLADCVRLVCLPFPKSDT